MKRPLYWTNFSPKNAASVSSFPLVSAIQGACENKLFVIPFVWYVICKIKYRSDKQTRDLVAEELEEKLVGPSWTDLLYDGAKYFDVERGQ